MREGLGVIVGLPGFEAEHLDEGAGRLVEMQARLYDFRVVEYHERARLQIVRQLAEHVLAHRAVAVDEQFRRVALGQGILGDALVGQGVVVVADVYMLRFFHDRPNCKLQRQS